MDLATSTFGEETSTLGWESRAEGRAPVSMLVLLDRLNNIAPLEVPAAAKLFFEFLASALCFSMTAVNGLTLSFSFSFSWPMAVLALVRTCWCACTSGFLLL